MAGNYPDATDHRMALDRDGTQIFFINTNNIVTQYTDAQVKSVNDETDSAPQVCGQNDSGRMVVIFPENRDVVAYYCNLGYGSYVSSSLDLMESSSDTTYGVDGTWSPVTPLRGANEPMSPAFRSNITRVSQPNIRALRLSVSAHAPTYGSFVGIHVYGTLTAGQNPDRLELWHPTLDQRVGPAYFDYGNAPRVTTADKTFRVKNRSAALNANVITVSLDTLTDATPTTVLQHTLSADGITFAATASAGTLAPGAISGILTLRRTTSIDAQVSLWALRVIANAATWS